METNETELNKVQIDAIDDQETFFLESFDESSIDEISGNKIFPLEPYKIYK